MRLLVTTNGICYSGAQVATNEFLSFLAKLSDIRIKIVSCLGVNTICPRMMSRYIECLVGMLAHYFR